MHIDIYTHIHRYVYIYMYKSIREQGLGFRVPGVCFRVLVWIEGLRRVASDA